MKRTLLAVAVALVAASGSFTAQVADDARAKAPRILMSDFKKLWEKKDVIVVDVRSVEGFKAGHIPGAIHIPLASIESRVEYLTKLGKPIVTYCSCTEEHTAADAVLTLGKAGVKNVSALKGGFQLWSLNRWPVSQGNVP